MCLKYLAGMGNIIKYIHKLGMGLLRTQSSVVNQHNGNFPNLEKVKCELKHFTGGSVELEKDKEKGIAVITLNYPEKKNAMSGKMMAEMFDAIAELERWETGKGVLLCGQKGSFCSGGDLDFVRKMASPEMGFKMSSFMIHTLTRLQNLPIISVAYIEGAGALGGGAEICLACDFRLITQESRIGFVHSRMGIIPAWGGNMRLTEVVGKTKALDLVVTGKILNAQEASDCSLVDEIVFDRDEALRWLEKKVKFHYNVVRAAKAAILARNFETESRIFAPLFGSIQNRQALEDRLKHKL